ncbi:MAG: hypothetical protein CSB33_03750 [Desulfobacterales bacterium]|nr:MAG: hypothetical protein CSB33_03750 [Desulfobacterales bacterium]
MESVSWLTDPVSVWFFIGLCCIIGEFIHPGVVIVFFGVGAWFTALLVWFFPLPVPLQVLIFTLVSIISLVTLRHRINPLKPDVGRESWDDFVGKIAEVTETVPPDRPGQIRFKGALWKAETRDGRLLEKGERVRITARESITLIVSGLESADVSGTDELREKTG